MLNKNYIILASDCFIKIQYFFPQTVLSLYISEVPVISLMKSYFTF
jgi:hypothetical protein